MKKIILLTFFTFYVCLSYASITIQINTPVEYGVSADELTINVTVQSDFDISTIKAKVLDRETNLSLVSQGNFTGTISLTGLPHDTLTLKVFVTDIMNTTDSATRLFIFDVPPQFISLTPLNYSVARPFIKVHATGTEGSTIYYTLTEQDYMEGHFINTFKNSFDTIFDLSADEGNYVRFHILLKNVHGQNIDSLLVIYVNSSPYLQEYDSTADIILDFNYNKLLTAKNIDPSPWESHEYADLNIVNLPGHTLDHVTSGSITELQAHLTPYGVTYHAFPTDEIYDWQNGITSRIDSNLANDYWAQGKYVADEEYTLVSSHFIDSLFIYDAGNKKRTFITTDVFHFNNGLANNGDAVYVNNSKTIVRYRNGINEELTSGSNSYLPFTDGKRIVYNRSDGLYLMDDTSDIKLSDYGIVESVPENVQINNGFVVFQRHGNLGQLNIWERDSLNKEMQITEYGNTANLELLDTNGNISFVRQEPGFSNFRYLFKKKTNNITKISTYQGTQFSVDQGTPFSVDTNFYIAIGRMLYKVNTEVPENKYTAIDKEMRKNTQITFSANDFTNAFVGPSQLITATITKLPMHGKLYISPRQQREVIPNESLSKSLLNTLKYVPTTAYVGNDTIYWNAYNGLDYTQTDGMIIIKIESVLPVQLISFTATKSNSGNLLQWQTAQEINSYYFDIEHSTDGRNFTSIGKVAAKGNSSTRTGYEFIHIKVSPVINYYRLKITDLDGSFTYSDVRSVNNTSSLIVNINPNPVRGKLNLSFTSDEATDVEMQVVTIEHKIVLIKKMNLSTGSGTETIDVSSLSNGIYYMIIKSHGEKTTLKFIKQR